MKKFSIAQVEEARRKFYQEIYADNQDLLGMVLSSGFYWDDNGDLYLGIAFHVSANIDASTLIQRIDGIPVRYEFREQARFI
jgi:hypothetical protein